MKKLLKVVFDSTILVSAFLTQGGLSAELLRLARLGGFALFSSHEILTETRRSLLQKHHLRRKYPYTDAEVEGFISGLFDACTLVANPPQVNVITEDPDDNPIIGCAVAARCDYLVTRDAHLLAIKEYQGVAILTPEALIRLLRGQ